MTPAKKILVFRYATAIGGAERYLETLWQHTPERVRWGVATNNRELAAIAKKYGHVTYLIDHYAPEAFSKKNTLNFYRYARRSKSQFDRCLAEFFAGETGTVFCQSLGDKLLVTPLAARRGLTVVWTEHGPMIGNLLRFKPLVAGYRRISQNPALKKVLCVSQTTRENILGSGLAPRLLQVIYNGTPASQCPPKLSSQTVRLVVTNRLFDNKGHRQLLSALSKIKDLSWQLKVVGDGPALGALKDYTAELELTHRVEFLGFTDRVAEQLCAADIYINPTIYPAEGLPISNIEALAAGVPIISSSYGGAKETVQEEKSGYLIDPLNADQFSQRLKQLITDSKKRAEFGLAAQRDWQERFDSAIMVKQTYHQLLS